MLCSSMPGNAYHEAGETDYFKERLLVIFSLLGLSIRTFEVVLIFVVKFSKTFFVSRRWKDRKELKGHFSQPPSWIVKKSKRSHKGKNSFLEEGNIKYFKSQLVLFVYTSYVTCCGVIKNQHIHNT